MADKKQSLWAPWADSPRPPFAKRGPGHLEDKTGNLVMDHVAFKKMAEGGVVVSVERADVVAAGQALTADERASSTSDFHRKYGLELGGKKSLALKCKSLRAVLLANAEVDKFKLAIADDHKIPVDATVGARVLAMAERENDSRAGLARLAKMAAVVAGCDDAPSVFLADDEQIANCLAYS